MSETQEDIPEEIKELIPGFIENRKNDIQSLEKAIVVKDFETIQTIGHNLSGVAASYGFPQLEEIGRKMEHEILGSRDLESIKLFFEEFKLYIDNIEY